MSSANSSSLQESKICRLGKSLKIPLKKQADGIDQDETARFVQSNLDLCSPQKHLFTPIGAGKVNL